MHALLSRISLFGLRYSQITISINQTGFAIVQDFYYSVNSISSQETFNPAPPLPLGIVVEHHPTPERPVTT